jgi:hypothetical protein
MSKYLVKRPRNLGEIKRIDEKTRVSDLAPAAAAHEAPKLLLSGPSLPRRLLLEGAEGSKVTMSINDQFHGGGTESADQLLLQVCDAHVETQPFHINTSEVGPEAGPLETTPEIALLCGVAKTRQPDVRPLRAEPIQEASYCLRAPNGHNGNTFGRKIPTTTPSERLERDLVADAFNEHDRARFDTYGRPAGCANRGRRPAVHRPFDVRKGRSLLSRPHPRIFTVHMRRARAAQER